MTDLPPALAKLGHHTSVATIAALRELAGLAPSADQLAEWAMELADHESRFSNYDEVVVEVDLRGRRINLSALDAKGCGHGYRLTGPKFGAVNGEPVVTRHVLDDRDVEEIREYLNIFDRIKARQAAVEAS